MTDYTPKGRMAEWLAAMRANPGRTWTTAEAAAIMGIDVRRISGYAAYALRCGAIYRSKLGRGVRYSLKPFPDGPKPAPKKPAVKQWSPEGDPRVPKVVPGWMPPKMTSARLGQ